MKHSKLFGVPFWIIPLRSRFNSHSSNSLERMLSNYIFGFGRLPLEKNER